MSALRALHVVTRHALRLARASVLVAPLAACGDDSSGGGGAGGAAASTTTSSGATTSTTATSSSGDGSGGATGSTGGGGPTSTTSTTTTSTTTSAGGGSNESLCATAGLAICEGFEGADDGAFPAAWGARGDEWGEGVIGVASDDAVRGSKSLKVDGGHNGQRFMDFKGDLGALASHHYGRVFMKVAVPAPVAASGVLHADFIEGLGPGPNGSQHNVRWGTVGNTDGMFQWIYNVQPSNGDPEFGEGTAYDYTWTGQWQCIEWMYDEPTQDGTLWIDGVELPIVPGANHAAELPVFDSLGVGLANYQEAGDGFTVWFDELAYDADRIGCDR